jgi:hypothetical protein
VTFMVPAIWLQTYLITNLSDSELAVSKPIWFWTYLIPNLSDSEAIFLWTHLIPNLSDSRSFWFENYLTLNPSDTDLSGTNPEAHLADPDVSPQCLSLPSILRWPPSSPSVPFGKISDKTGQPQYPLPIPARDDCQPLLVPCGKIGDQTGQPQSSPSYLMMTTNLSCHLWRNCGQKVSPSPLSSRRPPTTAS